MVFPFFILILFSSPIVFKSPISLPIVPKDDKGRLLSFLCSLSISRCPATPTPLYPSFSVVASLSPSQQRTIQVTYSLVFVFLSMTRCTAISLSPSFSLVICLSPSQPRTMAEGDLFAEFRPYEHVKNGRLYSFLVTSRLPPIEAYRQPFA